MELPSKIYIPLDYEDLTVVKTCVDDNWVPLKKLVTYYNALIDDYRVLHQSLIPEVDEK